MGKRNPRERYALNNIDAGSQRYIEDLRRYNDYYGPTQTYLRENPEEKINLDNRSSRRSIFEDYDNAPTLDSEKTWFQKAGEKVTNVASNVYDDILNSNRMFMNRLIEQFIDGDLNNVREAQEEQEDLNRILEYKNLHKRLRSLKQHPQFDERGRRIDPRKYEQEINEIEQKIKQYDDYFMGEGRSHTVIAQQMFDTSKMDVFDTAYANSLYVTKDVDRTNQLDGSFGGVLNYLTQGIKNISSVAGGAIDWLTTTGAQGINNLFGNGDSVNGYKTGEVIKSLDPRNKEDRMFLDKLYKGSFLNVGDVVESIDEQKIKSWQEYNQRRINEFTANLRSHQQFSKDGKLFGIDIYDPEDIPQQFKDEQQKFGQSLIDYLNPYKALIYTFPEVASTVGMMKYQVGAMGIDGLMQYVARRAPVWAIGGKGKFLQGVGNVATSALGRYGMESTAVGAGIWAAERSRRTETGLEAINAIGARVSQAIEDGGGDVQRIVDAVNEKGSKMGIDTSGWTLDRIVNFAIAYNLDVGDSVFDKAKDDARKGINKLINSNNALAVIDYLQAFPFMQYSGSAIKSWAAGMFERNAGKYGPIMPTLTAVEKSKPIMQAVNDATIGRLANKFIKDGAVKKGLYIKHAGEWGLKKIPLIAGESFSEGLEEVNQELLQSKYQRGLYDTYNKAPNMLDINEVFDNANLSFEGIAAYFGITPWDPELNVENVQKAFHIGAATSGMFAGMLRAATNIIPSDHPNVRNLVAQLKSDKQISNIVANYYNQVQDQKHLELFFDAFTKAGMDRSRLQKSLSDLRDAVDEQNTLVRKDFIDSDIQLMNAAWALFKNDKLNKVLKTNGIQKYGDLHKQIVIDGAAAIVEEQKNINRYIVEPENGTIPSGNNETWLYCEEE